MGFSSEKTFAKDKQGEGGVIKNGEVISIYEDTMEKMMNEIFIQIISGESIYITI